MGPRLLSRDECFEACLARFELSGKENKDAHEYAVHVHAHN